MQSFFDKEEANFSNFNTPYTFLQRLGTPNYLKK